MNVAKIKAAVEHVRKAVSAAQAEITAETEATIKAGAKDPLQFNGLQALGSANLGLGKINERLDGVVEKVDAAVEKTTPKVKKEKAPKADKK